MIKVTNLNFAYNADCRFIFPDLICREADQWLIKGESGCGKTTFLHLLAGLLKPSDGEVLINDVDINKLAVSKADNFRGNEIGIVFQQHNFIRSLTLAENLKLARYLVGKKISDKDIAALLGRLNISDKQHLKVNSLSQVELQRLSIARSIINEPSVLLADEPTSSLDDSKVAKASKLKIGDEFSGIHGFMAESDHVYDEFQFNKNDPNHLMYVLSNAELVREIK